MVPALAGALAAILATRPGGAAPPPPFVSRVAAFRPRSVECRVTATLHADGTTVELALWGKPPALWRMDVTGVDPDRPALRRLLGRRMLFSGDLVQVSDPDGGGAVQDAALDPGLRAAAAARTGFALAEFLFVDDPAAYELVALVPQSVEGRVLIRYDFLLRRPPPLEAVRVGYASIWVDPQGGGPVRVQLYDPARRAVGLMALGAHRRVAPGVALPMTMEVFLETGGFTTAARALYQLEGGMAYVPARLDTYRGLHASLSLAYTGYRVNQRIDPGRFR